MVVVAEVAVVRTDFAEVSVVAVEKQAVPAQEVEMNNSTTSRIPAVRTSGAVEGGKARKTRTVTGMEEAAVK